MKAMSIMEQEQINEVLGKMIRHRVISGASWGYVSEEGAKLYYEGRRGAVSPYDHEPVLPGMYYDLASLTKVVGTTSRILQLAEEGGLRLDTPVCDILKDFQYPEITVSNLLLHNSGLMAEVIHKETLTRDTIVPSVYATPRIFPCNAQFLYSDTGFILLGFLIQELDGCSLEDSLRTHVFAPLQLCHTSYLTEKDKRYIPTECTEQRGCICGEVHDSKAYLLGQSGSAGLFSTLDDMAVFAWHYLTRSRLLFQRETYDLLEGTEIGDRTYGWSREYGDGTLYHTGFTGVSMLLDMKRGTGFILLTNRIHPSRAQVDFLEQRKKLNKIFLELN